MAERDNEVREEVEGEGEIAGGQEYEGSASQTEDDAALDSGQEQEAGLEDDLAVSSSRGSERFQRLANENSELRRERDELRRAQQQQVQQPREETDQEFQARISLLSSDERSEARLSRAERFNQLRMSMMAFQLQDQADRAEYNAKAASDPIFKQYADEVERRVKELHAKGQTVTREAMLRYVIGDKRLSSKGRKETDQERQAGQRRVQRQQTRPSTGRSDVSSADRRALSDREARARRLEGEQI